MQSVTPSRYRVSIPRGAVKSLGRLQNWVGFADVSIPRGAVKSIESRPTTILLYVFQFQEVQLKA